DADGLPLQVGHTFDLGKRHHVKGRHVGDSADEDEVSTAKSRTDDRSSSRKSYLRVAGENDSCNLKRGGNVDQFYIEAILRKEILLCGIPKRSIDPANRRIDDVQFRSRLRPRRSGRQPQYQCGGDDRCLLRSATI